MLRKIGFSLLLITLISSQVFGQKKQLLSNAYANIGISADFNVPADRDFSSNSGFSSNFMLGGRFVYFFSFGAGFAYNYQETKFKNPNDLITTIAQYPSGTEFKKRKYRFQSIGVPVNFKFYIPLIFAPTDNGFVDVYFGYEGCFLFAQGDNLLDVLSDKSRNVTYMNDRLFRTLHRAQFGFSFNAGEKGEIDIGLHMGGAFGQQYVQSNYFTLGLQLCYKIYWFDWGSYKSSNPFRR